MWESHQNGVKAEACLKAGGPGGVWGLELSDPSKARRGLVMNVGLRTRWVHWIS